MRRCCSDTQRALKISVKLFSIRGPGIQKRYRIAGQRKGQGRTLYERGKGVQGGRQRNIRRRGKEPARNAAAQKREMVTKSEIQTEVEKCECKQ